MSHHHPKPVLSRFYPRWITDRDGLKRLVQNQQEHGNFLFCEFDENAQPLYAPPPTLREVLAQAYTPEAALEIVAEEERKARANEWPYYVGASEVPPVSEPLAMPANAVSNPDPPPAEPYPAAEVVPPTGPLATQEEAAALGIQAPETTGVPLDFAEVEKVLTPSDMMPVSEPLPEPELPHETELVPVEVAAEPVTDEIEALFAQKSKQRGRKAKE